MPPANQPSLKIEHVAPSSLAPFARNSRTHDEAQVAQIAASIREFGFTNPILVDGDGGIIAGHGRVLAALRLQLPVVPIIRLPHLTEVQRRAYVIADNQIALNAGWNLDTLRAEIGGLQDSGFSLDTLAFGEDELSRILSPGTPGRTDPDEAPAVASSSGQLGDVWRLGRHRLVCGDSTVPLYVELCLGGEKPNLMVTDPPYGVEYDAAWRQRADKGARATGAVMNDDRADWRKAWALFPGNVAYVWHAGTRSGDVAASLLASEFHLRAQIVWVKSRHVLSRGDYHHQHEPLFYGVRYPEHEDWHFVPEHEVAGYAVRRGQPGAFVGDRKQSTVWFIEHLQSETGHSTQKPVECMRRPIENNSKPGGLVYDPFVGSGTTLIAAEMTGRCCHAIELSPAYVDVAVKRWENFTGQTARLERKAAAA